MTENQYKDELRRLIANALRSGASTFADVYRATEGADPRMVFELYTEAVGSRAPTVPAASNSRTTQIYPHLPASNPLLRQWWFRQDSATTLASLANSLRSDSSAVVFIGAPTVAHAFSYEHGPAISLDADADIATILRLRGADSQVRRYHTNESMPLDLRHSSTVVVTDPPWYPEHIKSFLVRSSEVLKGGGSVLCSLPPRLTRATIDEERGKLLTWMITNGYQLVSLEPQKLTYLVPGFESSAFDDLAEFDHRPWRRGDLLHARYVGPSPIAAPPPIDTPDKFSTYARDPSAFRVFLRHGLSDGHLGRPIRLNADFQRNVSGRHFNSGDIGIWTSDNRGGAVDKPAQLEFVLSQWEGGATDEQAIVALMADKGLGEDVAKEVVGVLRDDLNLWSQPPPISEADHEARIEEALARSLNTELAAVPSGRVYNVEGDGFRLQFQRDRDRIIWSHGLRGLANKTQVFSTAETGVVRQRLAHSIEVMQLAQTIGRNLSLHPDLIQAGALAHDIGHTPFGHAGEYALDRTLNDVDTGFAGFNHYEHGVDVVRWLEDAYQSTASGAFPGLNLTPEVAECIFKHTYCHSGRPVSQAVLYAKSKHQGLFGSLYCHLEGQAVRIADKVSYLISDIEDGIRMGVFGVSELLGCHLFNTPPIDLLSRPQEDDYQRFISQRRLVIKVIMEDVIRATQKRLATFRHRDQVRKADFYTVDYSDDMRRDIDEVYRKLQRGKLHKDARVLLANIRSAEIISKLFVLFAFYPDLVEKRFRLSHSLLHGSEYLEFYRSNVGKSVKIPESLFSYLPLDYTIGPSSDRAAIPTEDVVLSKDYVASLTDGAARSLAQKYLQKV